MHVTETQDAAGRTRVQLADARPTASTARGLMFREERMAGAGAAAPAATTAVA
jgi:hypothetical protein